MKFSVKQEILVKALVDVKRIVPSKPQLPILQAILIQADSGNLILSATDLYTGIKSTIVGVVDTPGQVAVPAQALTEVITTLNPGNLDFELKENTLHISGKGVSIKIQTFNVDDYPPFPEKEGESITLPKEELQKIVDLVVFATAKDDSRPILTAILFNFDGAQEIVATDGFRLATLGLDKEYSQQKMLIPAKAILEISRLQDKSDSSEVEFTISRELKQIFCSFGNTQMVIRLMEGEYPPYEKIIPNDFSTQISVDREEMIQAIKGAMIFARESSNIVRFEIENNQMVVTATSPTLGTHKSEIPVNLILGSEGKIAFNAQYLMEFLTSVKENEIWIGMNDSLQPVLFRPSQMTDYRYIVMPFRVSE